MASSEFRLPLIPTIGYFDDLGVLAHASETTSVMAEFAEFVDILRLERKLEKSDIGPTNAILFLSAVFPIHPIAWP